MGSSPRQRAGTQRPVSQDLSDGAQDHRVGTSTVLTWPRPMWLFLFPRIKSALKGTMFESVDAVKAKATELMNKLSENDRQHCFQQWKIRMQRCWDQGGQYIECDNISIGQFFWIKNVLTSVRLFYSHTTYLHYITDSIYILFFLTFCGPCIVIYLRNKDQQDAFFSLSFL